MRSYSPARFHNSLTYYAPRVCNYLHCCNYLDGHDLDFWLLTLGNFTFSFHSLISFYPMTSLSPVLLISSSRMLSPMLIELCAFSFLLYWLLLLLYPDKLKLKFRQSPLITSYQTKLFFNLYLCLLFYLKQLYWVLILCKINFKLFNMAFYILAPATFSNLHPCTLFVSESSE